MKSTDMESTDNRPMFLGNRPIPHVAGEVTPPVTGLQKYRLTVKGVALQARLLQRCQSK
jgi:hypothetical protein